MGGGGYLGQFLVMYAPLALRTPIPLKSILWPGIDPILLTVRKDGDDMGAAC